MMNRQEEVINNYQQNAATTFQSGEIGGNAEDIGSEKVAQLPFNLIVPPSGVLQNEDLLAVPAPGDFKKSGSDKTSATMAPIEEPMPKRNLSAYNLFFQVERDNIINDEEGMNYTYENIARVAARHYHHGKMNLPRRKHRKTHGKITFAELARSIATKWKALDPVSKSLFMERTSIEKERYQREIAEWADRRLQSQPKRNSPLLTSTSHTTIEPHGSLSAPADHLESLSDEIMPHRVFAPTSPQASPNFVPAAASPVSMYEPSSNVHSSGAAMMESISWRNPMNAYDYNHSQNAMAFSSGNFPQMRQSSPFQPIVQQHFGPMVPMMEPAFTDIPSSYAPSHNFMAYPTMRSSTQPDQIAAMRSPAYNFTYPPLGNILSSNAAIGSTLQPILRQGSTETSENDDERPFSEYKAP